MQRSNWYHVRHVLQQTWHHPSNRGHRTRSVAGALAWQMDKRLRRRPRDVPYFGMTLRCHPDSQSASNVLYFTERYDPDEMAVAEAYLRPGDWFLDVGANIGTYSLMARSFVGPDGRVDGFEPHPLAARRFAENVELNRLTNLFVHAVAVSDAAGTVEFLDGSDVSTGWRQNGTDRAVRSRCRQSRSLMSCLKVAMPWAKSTSKDTRRQRFVGPPSVSSRRTRRSGRSSCSTISSRRRGRAGPS